MKKVNWFLIRAYELISLLEDEIKVEFKLWKLYRKLDITKKKRQSKVKEVLAIPKSDT